MAAADAFQARARGRYDGSLPHQATVARAGDAARTLADLLGTAAALGVLVIWFTYFIGFALKRNVAKPGGS
jgi:hypothetical protein